MPSYLRPRRETPLPLPTYRRPVTTYTAAEEPQRLPVFAPEPPPVPPQTAPLVRPDLSQTDPALPVYGSPLAPGQMDSLLRPADPTAPGLAAARPPLSPYDAQAARVRALANTPAVDENGRLRSAAYGAAKAVGPATRTGSLGYATGALIGGALSGLIRPQMDEEDTQEAALARERAQMATEVAVEEHQTQQELRRAQAANQEALPVYRAEEAKRKQEADAARMAGLERRLDIYDAATQARIRHGDERLEDADLNRTSRESEGERNRQSRASEGEKNRGHRERITQMLIGSREAIAAQQQRIQRERTQLGREQFSQRYPGAGRFVTRDDLVKKFNDLSQRDTSLTIDQLTRQAIAQGYEIRD
jgi:hypothetical protein